MRGFSTDTLSFVACNTFQLAKQYYCATAEECGIKRIELELEGYKVLLQLDLRELQWVPIKISDCVICLDRFRDDRGYRSECD